MSKLVRLLLITALAAQVGGVVGGKVFAAPKMAISIRGMLDTTEGTTSMREALKSPGIRARAAEALGVSPKSLEAKSADAIIGDLKAKMQDTRSAARVETIMSAALSGDHIKSSGAKLDISDDVFSMGKKSGASLAGDISYRPSNSEVNVAEAIARDVESNLHDTALAAKARHAAGYLGDGAIGKCGTELDAIRAGNLVEIADAMVGTTGKAAVVRGNERMKQLTGNEQVCTLANQCGFINPAVVVGGC